MPGPRCRSHSRGIIASAYTVMECSDPEITKFSEAFHLALDDRKLLSPLYSGLRNIIPKGRLLSAKTPVPPPGRDAMLMLIELETVPLESARNRFSRQIALVREYLARLTDDVITGKIDVRDLPAARLAAQAEADTLPVLGNEAPVADIDLDETTDAEGALDVA